MQPKQLKALGCSITLKIKIPNDKRYTMSNPFFKYTIV